jgi:release factor glutamine methyltransferase
MKAAPAPSSRARIVARLRTAGCVSAEDEARLLIESAGTPTELAVMVDRRVAGEPIEHILGWAEFCGLRIALAPGVFVPRRRTEFLVDQARMRASQIVGSRRPVVVDLCCGSGAVGTALAAALDVELYAVDVDPEAVRCARRNVGPVGGVAYAGDLYAPLPVDLHGRVEVLVANAPYVPTEDIRLLPLEARLHEPRAALDGGADGLDVLRRIAAEAPQWLAPGGHLLVETSELQAPQMTEVVGGAGMIPRIISSEELNAHIVVGTRSAR